MDEDDALGVRTGDRSDTTEATNKVTLDWATSDANEAVLAYSSESDDADGAGAKGDWRAKLVMESWND